MYYSSSKIILMFLTSLLSSTLCQGYPSELDYQSNDASNPMVGLLNLLMQQAFSTAAETKTDSPASISTLSPNGNSQVSQNGAKKVSGTDEPVVIEMAQEVPSDSKDASVFQMQKTDDTNADKIKISHKIFTKTVRVNRVEEVYEDLFENKRRRVVKEDRFERIEVAKDKEMEKSGSEFDYDNIFSM